MTRAAADDLFDYLQRASVIPVTIRTIFTSIDRSPETTINALSILHTSNLVKFKGPAGIADLRNALDAAKKNKVDYARWPVSVRCACFDIHMDKLALLADGRDIFRETRVKPTLWGQLRRPARIKRTLRVMAGIRP